METCCHCSGSSGADVTGSNPPPDNESLHNSGSATSHLELDPSIQ